MEVRRLSLRLLPSRTMRMGRLALHQSGTIALKKPAIPVVVD
jgi:hypothetical protein